MKWFRERKRLKNEGQLAFDEDCARTLLLLIHFKKKDQLLPAVPRRSMWFRYPTKSCLKSYFIRHRKAPKPYKAMPVFLTRGFACFICLNGCE
jgi:hypothetical protein